MLSRKNISGYMMLVLLAFPAIFATGLMIRQKSLQVQMQAKIEKNYLQTISISDDNIIWINNGNEILLNGKSFDVKSFFSKDGNTVFTGLYDVEEDAVKEKLNLLAGQTGQNTPTTTNALLLLLFAPVYTAFEDQAQDIVWSIVLKCYPSFTEQLPECPVSALLLPPQI